MPDIDVSYHRVNEFAVVNMQNRSCHSIFEYGLRVQKTQGRCRLLDGFQEQSLEAGHVLLDCPSGHQASRSSCPTVSSKKCHE